MPRCTCLSILVQSYTINIHYAGVHQNHRSFIPLDEKVAKTLPSVFPPANDLASFKRRVGSHAKLITLLATHFFIFFSWVVINSLFCRSASSFGVKNSNIWFTGAATGPWGTLLYFFVIFKHTRRQPIKAKHLASLRSIHRWSLSSVNKSERFCLYMTFSNELINEPLELILRRRQIPSQQREFFIKKLTEPRIMYVCAFLFPRLGFLLIFKRRVKGRSWRLEIPAPVFEQVIMDGGEGRNRGASKHRKSVNTYWLNTYMTHYEAASPSVRTVRQFSDLRSD